MRADHRRYGGIQRIAREVLERLGPSIGAADTEQSIAERAVRWLRRAGITETWYYDCPALVLLGTRSTESVSGREYCPAHEPVGTLNLVTVDLSPCRQGIWGDCARSFAIEDGRFTASPGHPEFAAGLDTERAMHRGMMSAINAQMTFADVFHLAAQRLGELGYENLDRRGNFGHSIAARSTDRLYLTADNSRPLCDVHYFTFEPHIRRRGGQWGFKHEEIYFFDDRGQLSVL